jgi:hypothetical protein
LGQAKVIFSANLQETFGISGAEGILVDTIPMVPDRLSYSEIYLKEFKYPSAWTETLADYKFNKSRVIAHIRKLLQADLSEQITKQRDIMLEKYLTAGPMIKNLLTPRYYDVDDK